jgi:hypothetical protein
MVGKMMKMTVAALGLLLVGCGNGDVADESHREPVLPAGHYQLSFSADSTAGSPVNGVDLTLQLPDGVTVPTAQDGTGQIPGSALSVGSGLKGTTSLIAGHYLANMHQARLSVTTTAATVWKGEFAQMTVTIPPGVYVSENALMKIVGAGFPAYKVMGLTATNHDTVSLTDQVQTTVKLLR